jgi:formamidopyrimidine-DNA glycosylase
MFELPEIFTLARQMNTTLPGKVIQRGELGNSPHKFVWYNRQPEEFDQLTRGKCLGQAQGGGRWLFLDLEPGYRLVWGECGGRIRFHTAGENLPLKHHLLLTFEDGSALSTMTVMWGAMELYEAGKEQERQYIKGMRLTPMDSGFTRAYFSNLVDELLQGKKRSAKSLLTQDQLIPGLGNAIAQDILFNARLHPRRPLADLSQEQRDNLHQAVVDTVREVIAAGGRNDEMDLFGNPGGYQRIMDNHSADKPCPRCGTLVVKMQYLGGACYFCPNCQV